MTGPLKYAKYVAVRTGVGTYLPVQGDYRLQLDWIPVALKNRSRTMYNKVLGRIMHFRDRRVQEDMNSIRAIWARVSPRPPVSSLRMQLEVMIFRPMSRSEEQKERWNQRRGDTVSAHELICDALEGCFYENDSQVTLLTVEERRDCVAPSVIVFGKPR